MKSILCLALILAVAFADYELTNFQATVTEMGCNVYVSESFDITFTSGLTSSFSRFVNMYDSEATSINTVTASADAPYSVPIFSVSTSTYSTSYQEITFDISPAVDATVEAVTVSFTVTYNAVAVVRRIYYRTDTWAGSISTFNDAVLRWNALSGMGFGTGLFTHTFTINNEFSVDSLWSQAYPIGAVKSSTDVTWSLHLDSRGVPDVFKYWYSKTGASSCEEENNFGFDSSTINDLAKGLASWIIAVIVIGVVCFCVLPIIIIILCCVGVIGGAAHAARKD